MKCSIKIFAGVREAVGTDWMSIEIDQAIQPRQLKEVLAQHHPQAAELILMSRLAVSSAFVEDTELLCIDSDTDLALIPPVSGG